MLVNPASCTDLDEVKLTSGQYSLQHLKAFGIHNHLFQDPWATNTVYFVNSRWDIVKFVANNASSLNKGEPVLRLPDADQQRSKSGRHNVSLHFPSPDVLTVADGAGRLYVVRTGDRKLDQEWKVVFRHEIEGQNFQVVHSLLSAEGCHMLEVALLYVEERDMAFEEAQEIKGGDFVSVLEWLTLTFAAETNVWELTRVRRLEGKSAPDFLTLEQHGRGMIVGSEKHFTFVYDSVKPVDKAEVKESARAKGEDKKAPAYTWFQSMEDLTVHFTLPENTNKKDLDAALSHNYIKIRLQSQVLLEGNFQQNIDIEGSAWYIEGRRLELQLCKKDPAMWSAVVSGDDRGEMVVDPATAQEIHQRLEHLTSDTLNADPDRSEKPFNSQQLEECDTFPEETSAMLRFDGDTHQSTHLVDLSSHQWLFNTALHSDQMPAVCLRHDVDGLLWQPKANYEKKECPLLHIGTFNALGYVQASKRDKKFAGCSPDLTFAVLCDCVRHVFVYRQPEATLSPLRNRKTGREVGAVAKQQVISLDSTDPVMGLAISTDKIFVLTAKILHVIKVKET
ncbi:nudC domain-containing protein 1 isoform X2 [Lingula anatina]|uniref:NudC domain-containing protein 1 n=1 Tax=Lingula anatina TaxID=7574 RepID=A0A1S3H5V7_LINAN|nr:nudC domain-containing protein 1 isoform X2 [Lingula anatina]|eukprot:XP_013381383.1 nudC domain-containing protein 1 isoform X2 [Lingula anatina]